MITSEIQATSISPQTAVQTTEAGHHAFSFHDLLVAMNPLQYLPVVGTIYRVVTGDAVSEPVREAGSLLFSVLLGGPIGLIASIAATIAEKITGIDPEKIIAAQFNPTPPTATAQAETPRPDAAPADAAPSPAPTPPAETSNAEAASAGPAPAPIPPSPDAPTQRALTQEQLAAYGVRSTASGTLKLGDVEGADVLNAIQLVRLDKAAAAYAANQMTPLTAVPQGS
jgi:hypothetical protein